MANIKKLNIERPLRVLFNSKSMDPSLFDNLMIEFSLNGIHSIEDFCSTKEEDLKNIRLLDQPTIDSLKAFLAKYHLSPGMTKKQLKEYKKGILHVNVATVPNGYSLLTIKDGVKHEYLYFNLNDLMKGFMYHVGLEELENINENEIDHFIDASQRWSDFKELALDNLKFEEEIKNLTEKVNALTNEMENRKKSYEREIDNTIDKYDKKIEEIKADSKKLVAEKESTFIEAQYRMETEHKQQLTELQAKYENQINQLTESHNKEKQDLQSQINQMIDSHKKELDALNEKMEKKKTRTLKLSRKNETDNAEIIDKIKREHSQYVGELIAKHKDLIDHLTETHKIEIEDLQLQMKKMIQAHNKEKEDLQNQINQMNDSHKKEQDSLDEKTETETKKPKTKRSSRKKVTDDAEIKETVAKEVMDGDKKTQNQAEKKPRKQKRDSEKKKETADAA